VRARAGQLPGFTGIDSEYEVPEDAELVLRPSSGTIPEQISLVLSLVGDELSKQ
jgi:bifunctional enzyme CysN/CysC